MRLITCYLSFGSPFLWDATLIWCWNSKILVWFDVEIVRCYSDFKNELQDEQKGLVEHLKSTLSLVTFEVLSCGVDK